MQIKEINIKYADLEKNFITQRKQAKQEVASFLDDKVGINLNKLSRQLGRLEAKLSTNHQVCLYLSNKVKIILPNIILLYLFGELVPKHSINLSINH